MRIISGIWRSHPLKVPPKVRATTDRVREAIFSILGEAQDLEVLDLYAGSGSLGLEALSRGAHYVCFVDISQKALLTIKGNLQNKPAQNVRLVREDALVFLRKSENVFDWIFCDPPYNEVDYARLLTALSRSLMLHPQTLLILEMDRFHHLELPDSLNSIDQRKFGDTIIHFIKAARNQDRELSRA